MSEALNVTKAAFGGLREVTTAPLWQYDYGQILQITGLDLPQAFEVHFSNSRKSGETITQIGTDSQVVIPDMYLTSGADIYAFIFLHDGLTDGETEYVIKIPVRERPEPSDIEPTPEQQDAITEAIATLNDGVAKSETNVTHYPKIVDGYWCVWDAQTEAFVNTGVAAQGEKGDGGLSVFMDKPCDLIPTGADRKMVADYVMSFRVYAFKGSQRQAITDISCSNFSLQTADGVYHTMVMPNVMDEYNYWTVSKNIKSTVKRVGSSEYEPLYMEHDTEVITLTVTVDGKTFTLKHSITAAKQGVQGEKGDTGETGATGAKGEQGERGLTGQDGISPTVTITPITGGHRITITDKDGEHSVDVMDGTTPSLTNYVQFTDLATTTKAGVMSAQDKSRLDDVYADYSSALTALGVI